MLTLNISNGFKIFVNKMKLPLRWFHCITLCILTAHNILCHWHRHTHFENKVCFPICWDQSITKWPFPPKINEQVTYLFYLVILTLLLSSLCLKFFTKNWQQKNELFFFSFWLLLVQFWWFSEGFFSDWHVNFLRNQTNFQTIFCLKPCIAFNLVMR